MKISQRHCHSRHPLLLRGPAAGILLLSILWNAPPLRCDAAILSGPTLNPSNGHTYYLLNTSSWTDAQAEAVSLGGNLVTINDSSENQWVYQTFQPFMPSIENGGGALWIGLHAPSGDDRFVWVSGDSATYRNFQLGQPDKLGIENYVHLWGPTSTATQPLVWGQWNNLVDSGWPIPCFGVVEIDGPAALPPGGHLTSDATAPLNLSRQTIHFILDLNGTHDLSRVRETTTSPNLVMERGGNRTAIGALVDDGLHGDGAAGDFVFGLSVELDVEPSMSYSFIASTAYRGRAARKLSDTVDLYSRAPTPEELCSHQGGAWHPETGTCCLPGSDACCGNPDPCCGSTDPACSGYPLLVGRGMHDVTGPAAGGGMMGYQKETQTAEGLHDRQWARAFIVGGRNPGDKRVIFVTVDTGQIFNAVTQGVGDLLNADDELRDHYSYENLVISATHTHGAASGSSHFPAYNLNVGGFQWQTYDAMVHGIFTAIKRAHRDLAPGRVLLNRGSLDNANENRAFDRFQRNIELNHPNLQNPFGPDGRDTEMLCLRFEHANGEEIGMLNWFPVHGTSVSNGNHLLTGDNKGLAAYLFERAKGAAYPGHPRPGGSSGFVAAFANSNAGDLSPNRFASEPAWPLPGQNDSWRVSTIGGRQYVKAMELYDGAIRTQSSETHLPRFLGGFVDFRHMYVRMTNVMVDPRRLYPYNVPGVGFVSGPLTPPWSTYKGALGVDFSTGRLDGDGVPGVLTELLRIFGAGVAAFDSVEQTLLLHHSPKRPLLLPTGFPFPLPYSTGDPEMTWMPQVLPVSLLRIGDLAILAVPAEFTSMAGARLRKTVEEAFGGSVDTVVAGYANDYSSYVTTFEEYSYLTPDVLGIPTQSYEAASTQFGPFTLAAYQTKFSELARAMVDGQATPSEPMPRTQSPGFIWRTLDPLPDGLPLEYETRAAVFKGKALSSCPDGQFWDPMDGGTCWSCPEDYLRTIFAVDSAQACERPPYAVHSVATRQGIAGCPPGQFWDPIDGGSCWSCPSGYTRTIFAVNGSQACERPAYSDFAGAIDHGPSGCPAGQFPDVGACWSCPSGYNRTIFVVYGPQACERPAQVNRTSASVLPPPPLFGSCPSGYSFELFSQACVKCPAGYSRTLFDYRGGEACERIDPAVQTAATQHGPYPCVPGAFPDIGRCWTCPPGYNRTIFAVNGGMACERVNPMVRSGATGYGRLIPCHERGEGQFLDLILGECWSCPPGYSRTVFPLNGDLACEQIIPVAQTSASLQGHITCEGRGQDVGEDWFLDLGLGECWSCGGWLRNLAPVNGVEGCTGPRVTYGSVVKELEWQLPEELRRYQLGQTISIEFWAGHPKNVFGREEAPTLDAVPTFFEVQRLSNGGWETIRTDADWDTSLEWSPFLISIPPASKMKVSWAIGGDTVPGTYRIRHHGQYKDLFTSEFRTYSGESPRFEVVP